MNSSRRVFISALNSQRNLSTSKGRSWSKSSPVHVTAILLGCVAFEFFYGAITESIWEGLNKGVRILSLIVCLINSIEAFPALPYGQIQIRRSGR